MENILFFKKRQIKQKIEKQNIKIQFYFKVKWT